MKYMEDMNRNDSLIIEKQEPLYSNNLNRINSFEEFY